MRGAHGVDGGGAVGGRFAIVLVVERAGAVAKALGVGTGTVQRIAREMEAARPFDGVSAAA